MTDCVAFRYRGKMVLAAVVLLCCAFSSPAFAAHHWARARLRLGDPNVICGTGPQKPMFPDERCGGDRATSAAGACALGTYCCNETYPPVCANMASGLPAACLTNDDVCKMPSNIHTCDSTTDSVCLNGAGTARKGQYCCANGPMGTGMPAYSPNVVNLTLFNGTV